MPVIEEPAISLPDIASNSIDRGSHARWPLLVTVVAILVGLVLRWVRLGHESLWFDEGYTAWVVSLSPTEMIRAIRVDTAPPLYYLLLRGWANVFGHSEAALRAMSALTSSLSLILFVPIARRILCEPWAVAAAVALFAVSEMQVAYAHEARFYSLITLLAAIDLLLVLLAIDRPSRWWWPAMIVAWTASLYTNNMMAVYLAALALAWLVLPGRRSHRGRVLDIAIVGSVAALLYLPWLPTMLTQSASLKGRFWVDRPDRRIVLRTLAVASGVNEQAVGWNWRRGITIVACAAVAFVIAGLIRRSTRRRAAALAIFGLLPIAVICVYSLVATPIFMERAFIASTLAMPLLTVLPLSRRWVLGAVTGVSLILGILSLRDNYLGEHRESWRDVSAMAASGAADHRRLLVFVANEGEIIYDYYARHGDYSSTPMLTGVPNDYFAVDPPHTMTRIRGDADLDGLRASLARGGFDDVVLVEAHYWFGDPSHSVLDLLKSRFTIVDELHFDDIGVYRFTTAR
jgi:uncharacterized membrane protein